MRLRGLVQTSGADPSSVLDSLWVAISGRDWERLTDARGRPLTFISYIREAQWDIRELYRFVHHNEHLRARKGPQFDQETADRMKWLRLEVTKLLPALGWVGPPKGNTDEETGDDVCNTNNESEEAEGVVCITNNDSAPLSTDSQYIARRLRRDASEANPDGTDRALKAEILADFDAGLLTAHAVAIRAGYRRPHLQAPDDPERLAAYLLRKWDRERIAALLAKLAEALT